MSRAKFLGSLAKLVERLLLIAAALSLIKLGWEAGLMGAGLIGSVAAMQLVLVKRPEVALQTEIAHWRRSVRRLQGKGDGGDAPAPFLLPEAGSYSAALACRFAAK